ncbi:MAG: RHS repeat protein [Gemmatimonadetes bacterium]|nr:RHS repeat protein [Gemmatimonadota bacterium]
MGERPLQLFSLIRVAGFTYHATNQVLTATGLDADIARSYHSSGALMSETQVVKTRSRTGTPHTYSLNYGYDINGRRTSLLLSPTTLFTGSAMSWSYTSWGALAGVTDIAGNSFSFTYNGRGLLTNVSYPAGIAQTLGYDLAGRLNLDQILRPGSTAFPNFGSTTIRNFSVASRNARADPQRE